MMIMKAKMYIEDEVFEIRFRESERNSNLVEWVELGSSAVYESHKRSFQKDIESGAIVVTGFYDPMTE